MDIIKERLIRIISFQKEMIDTYIREYKRYKNIGRIYVKRCRGKVQFVEYKDGRQFAITKDKERVLQAARYEYFKAKAVQAKEIYKCLEEALKKTEYTGTTEDILDKYGHIDKDRITAIENVSKYETEYPETESYMPEGLRYITGKGVRMRSKSERTIGNYLESRGIPYLYEAPLEVGGIILHPDFTLRKYDGSKVIWEHFGLMGDEMYYRNAVSKIMQYRNMGFKLYKDLIFTMEEDLEDMNDLDEIVYRYIVN